MSSHKLPDIVIEPVKHLATQLTDRRTVKAQSPRLSKIPLPAGKKGYRACADTIRRRIRTQVPFFDCFIKPVCFVYSPPPAIQVSNLNSRGGIENFFYGICRAKRHSTRQFKLRTTSKKADLVCRCIISSNQQFGIFGENGNVLGYELSCHAQNTQNHQHLYKTCPEWLPTSFTVLRG